MLADAGLFGPFIPKSTLVAEQLTDELLVILCTDSGITIEEIGERVGITRNCVRTALKMLERKGLVRGERKCTGANKGRHYAQYWYKTTEEERREILRLPSLKDN